MVVDVQRRTVKNCASFGGGGNLDAEEDGDERLVLVDRPEERLERLEPHRFDAHDALGSQAHAARHPGQRGAQPP